MKKTKPPVRIAAWPARKKAARPDELVINLKGNKATIVLTDEALLSMLDFDGDDLENLAFNIGASVVNGFLTLAERREARIGWPEKRE